ncbi:TPA: NAD-dependent malic enzyme [Salmonella enterica]
MIQYTHLSGTSLIGHSLLNKGTAFTASERQAFNLNGLLPAKIETLEEQVKRVNYQISRFVTDEAKHVFLRNLQDTNETLFYKYIINHMHSSLPLIYTPTVGYACQHYSEIWRKSRGLFISWEDRDNIDVILRNISAENIKVIVVTDGERILGLGDLGIGGMGIPVGKLSLYSACGGIEPQNCLPVMLDVGTNNESLLDNPMYMGARHKRISDDEYYHFVDAFINALEKRWPGVLLQFEDFALRHATPLLKKYQDRICCFNDDIQGTAAVTLGTLRAACQKKGQKLSEQNIMFVGAGSAGCGIAELIISAMKSEGLDESTARNSIFMVDKEGLLLKDSPGLTDFQYRLAHMREMLNFSPDNKIIEELVASIKPTVLIGVSGVSGLFTEKTIKMMYSYCEEPIIFPLSNPTSKTEAAPEDIVKWTNGSAIIATGSPFPPVVYNGKQNIIPQCNNAYIFPGIGLGVIISGATRVTQNMFIAASQALADAAVVEGRLLPDLNNIRQLSKSIALTVASAAVTDSVAPAVSKNILKDRIKNIFWTPEYAEYKRVSI